VYSKLHSCNSLAIVLALGFAGVLRRGDKRLRQRRRCRLLRQPAPAAASTGQTGSAVTGTLRGHIADPTGALIPGAKITIATPAGAAVTSTTADSAGAYVVSGLSRGGISCGPLLKASLCLPHRQSHLRPGSRSAWTLQWLSRRKKKP